MKMVSLAMGLAATLAQAQTIPVQVTLTGEVTGSGIAQFQIGDPFTLTFSFETTAAGECPGGPDFSSELVYRCLGAVRTANAIVANTLFSFPPVAPLPAPFDRESLLQVSGAIGHIPEQFQGSVGFNAVTGIEYPVIAFYLQDTSASFFPMPPRLPTSWQGADVARFDLKAVRLFSITSLGSADEVLEASVTMPDLPDADADGIPDVFDNCPSVANPDQTDVDGNRVGDACNGSEDIDGDDWADTLDNCPAISNRGQEDREHDGIGDICDPFPDDPDNEHLQCQADLSTCRVELSQCLAMPLVDADGDGESDTTDRCPGTPTGVPVDDSGCSPAQFCGKFDATTRDGARTCKKADWQNDEPLMRRGQSADCVFDKGTSKAPIDDRCVPSQLD